MNPAHADNSGTSGGRPRRRGQSQLGRDGCVAGGVGDRANGARDFNVMEDGLLLDPEELFHVEEAYAVLIRGDDSEEMIAGDSDVTGG